MATRLTSHRHQPQRSRDPNSCVPTAAFSIQLIIAKAAWKAHILRDLQPYICTYEECEDGHHLFSSRTAWLEHERLGHRAWQCFEHAEPTFKSKAALQHDLESKHVNDITETQIQNLIEISELSIQETRTTCPFCLLEAPFLMGFEDHIAFHLLSFAMFSVSGDTSTYDDDNVDANKSQSGLSKSTIIHRGRTISQDNEATSQNTGGTTDIQEALDTIPEVIKISADQEVWINAGLSTELALGMSTESTLTQNRKILSLFWYKVRRRRLPKIQLRYRAIMTKLARPRAYVKLFAGANGSWERRFKNSLWLQHLLLDEKAPIDIPCFLVVELDSYQYTILDFKDEAIRNLPPLLSSTPYISHRIFTILEHLAKYTFVQILGNRRANNLTDSDFHIDVEARADDLHLDKSGSSIIVRYDSLVYIEFHNLMEEALYITILNLTPLRQIECLYAGIILPGVFRVNVIVTVPARLRQQKQSSSGVEDIF
ncbi:MAG: hypothetical protein Q9171_005543 [Xanthocarpia ochracea]